LISLLHWVDPNETNKPGEFQTLLSQRGSPTILFGILFGMLDDDDDDGAKP